MRGSRSSPQRQRRQARPGQLVVPDEEAARRLRSPISRKPGPSRPGERRRRLAVGDEVDFMDQPVVAVGGGDLDRPAREVVAQRRLAERPGDGRPRRLRFAQLGGDGAPVGALEVRREAGPDAEAERVGEQRGAEDGADAAGRGEGDARSRSRSAAAPAPASGCGRARSPCSARRARAATGMPIAASASDERQCRGAALLAVAATGEQCEGGEGQGEWHERRARVAPGGR